jgi:hypothetical protein
MRLHALYLLCWPILICSSVVTCGRTLLTEQGRSLHQSTACEAIRNCDQCFTTKDEESVTMLACRTCASGYRPSSDLTACGKTYAQHSRAALSFTLPDDPHHAECAPGYHYSGGNCTICPKGSYCLGGSEPARWCAEWGLTTLTKGARSPTSCGKDHGILSTPILLPSDQPSRLLCSSLSSNLHGAEQRLPGRHNQVST